MDVWRTRPRAAAAATMVLAACLGAAFRAGAEPAGGSTLRFLHRGQEVGRVDLGDLRRALQVRVVTVDDPYYGRRKSFHSLPLGEVLAIGFGARRPAEGESYFFRARDGYVKPAPAVRVHEPGGHLAFGDVEHGGGDAPRWEPIDRRQVDPGPYYVVWAGEGQQDVHRYPWPYQLAAIEIAAFADEYPRTVPTSAAPGAAAWEGFEIFRNECIACHAINGQGGTIGPDLNVPQSIVEYRPRAQVKAYIRNPATFRYTSMPAHPHLSDAQLDAIVAYFDVMQTLKRDPRQER